MSDESEYKAIINSIQQLPDRVLAVAIRQLAIERLMRMDNHEEAKANALAVIDTVLALDEVLDLPAHFHGGVR